MRSISRPGVRRSVAKATGGRPIILAILLKLYIYGYLNRVQSSRRLEREARRNVELMWLTRAARARPQDDRRLPQGQRRRRSARSARSSSSCAAQMGLFAKAERRHRRQQVQGGEQPRQELHAGQDGAAAWRRSRRASPAICASSTRPTGRSRRRRSLPRRRGSRRRSQG